MRCAPKPTSVKQPKWHSLSTSSTACWRWDARATSASYETTRTRDHCVHRLIHATRSPGVEIGARLGDHKQCHMSMLPAAEFGALAAVTAGQARLEPHLVGLPRNGIGLAGQGRHPN